MDHGRAGPAEGRLDLDRHEAERLLGELAASERIRSAALLDAAGTPVAGRGADGFADAATRFQRIADRARGAPISQAHVATGAGEVFAVRGSELALVVSAPRFQLASLMLLDLRAVVRQLEGTVPRRDDLLTERAPVPSGSGA